MKNKKKCFVSLILGALFSVFSVFALCNNAIVETHAEQLPEQFASGFETVSLNTYEYNFTPSDYVETVLCLHEDFYFDNSNYPTSENITIGINTACIVHARCDAPVFDFPSNELTNINGYSPMVSSQYYQDKYYFFPYNGGDGSSLTFYINPDYYEMDIYLYYPLEIEVFCFPLIYSQMFGYDTGYALGDNDGYFRGYEFGFQQAEFYWKGQLGNDIETAYNNGYNKGLTDNQDDIFEEGKKEGYRFGYDDGFTKAEESTKELYSLMSGIMDAPISAIKHVLDFEIFGVNVSGAIFGILSLIIVAFVIKKVV